MYIATDITKVGTLMFFREDVYLNHEKLSILYLYCRQHLCIGHVIVEMLRW